jgi:drug/metabolite transporter (DMT)-like permease
LLGELSALATALCWSGSSISFAEATLRVGSVKVNVTRLILAAALIGTTLFLFGVPLKLSISQTANLSISGVLGLVFGDTFLFKSYEYNSARISALIMSSAPAIAGFLAYAFLGESLAIGGFLGMAVTLAGIALVVSGRSEPNSRVSRLTGAGIFYAFLGACGQAAGLITAKLAFNEGPINGLAATLVRILSALILLVPAAVISGHYRSPWKIFSGQRTAFGLTLLGAILGPCLGITFSLIAVAHAKVAIAATIMATVPIIMLPLVKLIYDEDLNWRAYSGALIAVIGVGILFLR